MPTWLNLTAGLAFLACASIGCRTPMKPVDTGCQPLDEIPYDGVDQDCDGADLTDVDGDGFDALVAGGEDCDDADAAIYPGAVETWYDGVDQDCDGASDYDQDGDGFDSDNHDGTDCDDSDVTANPAADEIWYDGVDQDCDGASDYDRDVDGYDSIEHDGVDCDDDNASINPGAAEIPYDGVDQDCDGADLIDVDEDGYVAVAAAGDDCDDEDPSVHPGADEIEDGQDQDCDDLVDETEVCADGTGDFETITAAIEGVVDGSLLELCPGTYEERLTLENRVLEIVGGGDLPEEVLLAPPTGGAGVELTGGSLAISNLTLEAASGEKAIRTTDGADLDVDLVDFCGNGDNVDGYAIEVVSGYRSGATSRVSRSHFCDCVAFFGSDGSGDSTVVGCVFDSAAIHPGHDSTSTINNNIFFGDSTFIHLSPNSQVVVRNNTIADVADFYFYTQVNDHTGDYWPAIEIFNNIFHNIETSPPDATSDVSALWAVYLGSNSIDDDGAPDVWRKNIVWDMTGEYAEVCVWNDSLWDVVCDGADAAVILSTGSIAVDPLFSPDSVQGTYALDPSSPAIDSGGGDPDADGTRNDIGAFGGPEGDWYMEVPWLP